MKSIDASCYVLPDMTCSNSSGYGLPDMTCSNSSGYVLPIMHIVSITN